MCVRVTSSWSVSSGTLSAKPLSSLSDASLDHMTSPEDCVHLERKDEDTRGEVFLEVAPNQSITGLVLSSSCPRWEVVGGIQYIDTLKGHKLELEEGDDEIPVYYGSMEFNKGHCKVTLKIPPGDLASCWIFLLGVTLDRSGRVAPSIGHFSLSSVDSILSSSSQPLSEKAQQFRTLFNSFQSMGPMQGPGPPFVSFPGGLENDSTPSVAQPPSVSSAGDLESSGSFLWLKSYIDQKFLHLEERLVKTVEEANKEQNDKLDTILRKLNCTQCSLYCTHTNQ